MPESSPGQSSFGWSEAPAGGAQGTPSSSAVTTKRRERPERRAAQPPSARASEPELPPDNELWDVRAAARFLKRSVSWVYHKAEDGTLPVRRLGGWGLRFIPGELRAWVESGGARPARR